MIKYCVVYNDYVYNNNVAEDKYLSQKVVYVI